MRQAHEGSEIASGLLLPFDRFEKTFEVASSKAIKVVPLNDLDKHSGTVHERFGEQLEQVSALVEVDEDVELLYRFERFIELQSALYDALTHGGVVGTWHADELYTPTSEVRYG